MTSPVQRRAVASGPCTSPPGPTGRSPLGGVTAIRAMGPTEVQQHRSPCHRSSSLSPCRVRGLAELVEQEEQRRCRIVIECSHALHADARAWDSHRLRVEGHARDRVAQSTSHQLEALEDLWRNAQTIFKASMACLKDENQALRTALAGRRHNTSPSPRVPLAGTSSCKPSTAELVHRSVAGKTKSTAAAYPAARLPRTK